MIKILEFYSTWCQPCKQIAPILEQIELTFDWVSILKIDIEKDEDDLAEQYNVRNIPTLLFFKDEKLVDKVVGLTSKSNLLDVLNKHA